MPFDPATCEPNRVNLDCLVWSWYPLFNGFKGKPTGTSFSPKPSGQSMPYTSEPEELVLAGQSSGLARCNQTRLVTHLPARPATALPMSNIRSTVQTQVANEMISTPHMRKLKKQTQRTDGHVAPFQCAMRPGQQACIVSGGQVTHVGCKALLIPCADPEPKVETVLTGTSRTIHRV